MRPWNSSISNSLWIVIVTTSSVLFSLALACATPFAAIAAIAGNWMSARSAFALTVVAWLANQLVGYLLLGYPTGWDSFAWGAAIGVAAVLATSVALLARRTLRGEWLALAIGFIGAFVGYESALFAATAFLPSGEDAFSSAVVAQIFWTNLAALAGLILIHRAALAIGLISVSHEMASREV